MVKHESIRRMEAPETTLAAKTRAALGTASVNIREVEARIR